MPGLEHELRPESTDRPARRQRGPAAEARPEPFAAPALEPPRGAPPDPAGSALTQVLARAVAARTPSDVVLMRAEGDEGTAVLDPVQERVSSEERAQLMTTYRLTDPAVLTRLLGFADDDVDGLQRLGEALAAKGAGIALALRLVRRASAARAALLVAATRHPRRLPQLLYHVPNAEVLRTLLLFEDEQDPTWLVRVCAPVPVGEQHMLPTLLERLPRPAAPALLGLERPSVLLGLVRLVDDPAPLVTVLPLVPDRALLRRCLELEPSGAVLASLCPRMSVDHVDLPALLRLVSDRALLVRLLTAESDGRRLVTLLGLAGDPAVLERLLRDVHNRVRLEAALTAVAAELGPGRAAAVAVEALVGSNLLGVVADQGRLKRVLTIIGIAQGVGSGADAMREALDEAAEFDYHWDFGIAAIESARAVTERLVDDERERLEGLDAIAIEQAIVDQAEEAKKSKLTKKERHKIDLYGPTGDEIRKKLRAGQEELAHDEIGRIKAKSAQALAQYRAGAAALAGSARKQEYIDYFKAVGFDPDALTALSATGKDLDAAQRLFGAIGVLPGLRASALDKTLAVDALERLATIPDPPRNALVASLSVATLKKFAANDDRTALLTALGTAGVATATIVDVGNALAAFDAHIDPTQHAALVALLGAFSVAEIQSLVALTRGAGKLAFLNTMRPRCTDFAALQTCLRLAARSKWSQAQISAKVPAGQAALDAAHVRTKICRGRADEFDKNTDFRKWVEAIAALIDDGYCTLSRTDSEYLPQLGDLGDTIESVITVAPIAKTFVLHTHPTAKDTGVNTSKYHIKPVRGNKHTPRVLRASIPEPIASWLPGLGTVYQEANYS